MWGGVVARVSMPWLACTRCGHEWFYSGPKPAGGTTECDQCGERVRVTRGWDPAAIHDGGGPSQPP